MRIPFLILSIAILAVSLTGCKFQTPEIRGVVLDAETKEPVEGGWVHVYIGTETKTVAGKVGKVISLEPPHTRTGRDGRFVIPSRSLKKPPFPVSFGSEVNEFEVAVAALDKSGMIKIDLKELKKEEIEITIYAEDIDKVIQKELKHVPSERFEEAKEGLEFSGIQGLYRYCLTGRAGIATPPVEGGCDPWELDFAIIKHERYLERLREPKNSDQKAKYANTLNQLGYLYERKEDIRKAITIYSKLMDFEGPGGWFYKSSEHRINELKKKLEQKQR